MLQNIDPLITPELLYVLAAMGHGDEVAIVDANFPAYRVAKTTCHGRPVPLPGATAPAALRAALSLLPLDDFVEFPVRAMAPDNPAERPAVQAELQAEVDAAARRHWPMGAIERFSFYDLASRSFVVVHSGEGRHWGNVLVAKGVLRAEVARSG